MQGIRSRRAAMARMQDMEHMGPQPPLEQKSFPFNYFSIKSFLVLLCVTASMLILPLVLPPLPPPPSMLLLLPVGMIGVLLVLAFMPSDLRGTPSSSL